MIECGIICRSSLSYISNYTNVSRITIEVTSTCHSVNKKKECPTKLSEKKTPDHLTIKTMTLSAGVIETSIARGATLVTLVDVGVPTCYIDRLIPAEKARYAIASASRGEAILL
jgi:hypothetical protein